MKERPIIFNAPMVRAILDGRKTQTRRVAKPCKDKNMGVPLAVCELAGEINTGDYTNSPYGQPGDRLWVRENHAPQADCWGSWDRWMRGDGGPAPIIHYAADFTAYQDGQGFTIRKPFIESWRPSIHMPRWASRILLEIVSVRVERLQDISEADAMAEGIELGGPIGHLPTYLSGPYAYHYAQLWESINGPGSWEANPLVWVIEFRKVEA